MFARVVDFILELHVNSGFVVNMQIGLIPEAPFPVFNCFILLLGDPSCPNRIFS